MAIKNIELGGNSNFISGVSTTFTEDLNDTYDRIIELIKNGK